MWNKGQIFYLKVKAHKFLFFGLVPLGLVDLVIDDVLDLLSLFPYKWISKGYIPLSMVSAYMDEVRNEAPLDLVSVKSNRDDSNADIRISIL